MSDFRVHHQDYLTNSRLTDVVMLRKDNPCKNTTDGQGEIHLFLKPRVARGGGILVTLVFS